VKTDVSKADEIPALARTFYSRRGDFPSRNFVAAVSYTKPPAARSTGRTLDAYGALHLLCNNTCVGVALKAAWETTLEDRQWCLGVNLWA
jgi:NAD(P)-dependent dehydrogenase (short-subunit alcohol dehydrogenase family)